jgi:hypothetical protein
MGGCGSLPQGEAGPTHERPAPSPAAAASERPCSAEAPRRHEAQLRPAALGSMRKQSAYRLKTAALEFVEHVVQARSQLPHRHAAFARARRARAAPAL